MKKIIKSIFAYVVCVFSLVSIFGCSCSKSIDVMYTIKVENETETTKKHKLAGLTILNKKYREPIDTPCYTKNGELIRDAQEVYECYDIEGNKFEKATHNRKEKIELSRGISLDYTETNPNKYVSTKTEAPAEEKYSLIYTFIITNYDTSSIYIKEFDVNTIINGQIKEDGLLKISAQFDCDKLVAMDGNENKKYYKLDKEDELCITVEIKGLLKKHAKKKVEEFNLNIPLVVRYN